jgi:hypothetical protein
MCHHSFAGIRVMASMIMKSSEINLLLIPIPARASRDSCSVYRVPGAMSHSGWHWIQLTQRQIGHLSLRLDKAFQNAQRQLPLLAFDSFFTSTSNPFVAAYDMKP